MTVPLRAALYLRVSTARRAEHDVSIPDQKRQGEAYCQSRGYQLAETYVEPGASATNDRRPEFQRMIEAGTSKPAPFDVVIVDSFSRFFRDHFELEFYVRKLAKNGVRLVSITQEMGDDPMHVMMRQQLNSGLVEKDYWIMHGLWGLQQLGLSFELKGGTSLSKGHCLIHRFSEDIDILIHPEGTLLIRKNQNKPSQVKARQAFHDGLPSKLSIQGFDSAKRDTAFDNDNMRSAGIRISYPTVFPLPEGVKEGILLEVGFDQVTPNRPCCISSWAYDKAVTSGLGNLVDNRAIDVRCYEPGYTLVEKLQTISTMYRKYVEKQIKPQNFLRYYYDVYCLLDDQGVQGFINSSDYIAHKRIRFSGGDNQDIAANPAFQLEDASTRRTFEVAYKETQALYYRGQPLFTDILERIHKCIARL